MSFKSPNYTQVPNDFFDMAKDMSESELRTTLALIRQTFGFHRRNVTLSIPEFVDATGLSDEGVRHGTKAAEKRGTFRRTNPDAKTKAAWELIVTDPNQVDLNQVDVDPNQVDVQPPVTLTTGTVLKKEKKVKKKKDYLDFLLETVGSENSEKSLRIAEMYDKMDMLFKSYFKRNANTDNIVKFILQREDAGETIEQFVQWVNRDEFNASRIWEYAENPIKIKTRWATALSDAANQEYTGPVEGV